MKKNRLFTISSVLGLMAGMSFFVVASGTETGLGQSLIRAVIDGDTLEVAKLLNADADRAQRAHYKKGVTLKGTERELKKVGRFFGKKSNK